MELKEIKSRLMRRRPEKKIRELTSFTVMISRGMGRVRSFTLSSRFLFWALVIFVLYIVVSAVGISLYVKGLSNETVRADQVRQLAYETEETKRALYQAKQRLKLLEETLGTPQRKDETEAGSSKSVGSHAVRRESASQEKAMEEAENGSFYEASVGIERLTTKRRGDRLSVSFRLVKTGSGRGQLKGYLFIIARDNTSDPPRFWTYPRVDLEDGIPVEYKRGELFKVRNYRIIRRSFVVDPPSGNPSVLDFVAFDTSGTLILNKTYAIEEAS